MCYGYILTGNNWRKLQVVAFKVVALITGVTNKFPKGTGNAVSASLGFIKNFVHQSLYVVVHSCGDWAALPRFACYALAVLGSSVLVQPGENGPKLTLFVIISLTDIFHPFTIHDVCTFRPVLECE